MKSSSAFFPCRIEWRPSPLALGALLLVGLLAVIAIWSSGLSLALRVLVSIAVFAHVAVVACREWRRVPLELVWTGGGKVELIEAGTARRITDPHLHRRGVLVQLRFRDAIGKPRHLLWWPDTLNAGQRRRLSLAVSTTAGRDSVLPLVAG